MTNDEFDFDESEIDYDEQFNAFIEFLKEKGEEDRAQILNPKRLHQMQYTFDTIKKMVFYTSPDAKITCGIHKIMDGSGYIDVETDEFEVLNIKQFISGIQYATNFETHPLLNGNIKLTIAFNDIMVEVPKK